MPSALNKSAYLVLGMIASGFTTGYDISKHAEIASRFFWAAGDGQVYPQLKKLAAAGLIESTSEQQGRRTRHVYSLTASGEQALQDWLLAEDPPMWELRDEALLQLFFSGGLTTGELRRRVDVIRRSHTLAVERLHDIEPLASMQPAALLTQRHGLAIHEAAIAWCDAVTAGLADADADAPAAESLAQLTTG